MLTPSKLKIIEIVWECPLETPLENCLFNYLRDMTLNKQIEEILSLTEAEEEILFRYHYACKHYRYQGNIEAIKKIKSQLI